jgi:hypothetical protein
MSSWFRILATCVVAYMLGALLSCAAVKLSAQERETTLHAIPVLVVEYAQKDFMTATFDIGSYQVEFFFRMLTPHPDYPQPTFPNGYEPVKAWSETWSLVSLTMGWDPIKAQDAEWDVYVRVYYPGDEHRGPVFVESNHVRVHR